MPTGFAPTQPGTAPAPNRRPLLLCLSHLRWDFVWQRPQHLLCRAARTHRVVVMEEPVIEADRDAPELDVSTREGGIRIAVPHLPPDLSAAETEAAQRLLLDGFLAGEGGAPDVLWFYTPMAMDFAAHVPARICVYDNMDELSAFRGASPAMLANEAALLARADLVFTGGQSLFEAKRDRHPRVHAFPSSIDTAHFRRAREPGGPVPAMLAGIAKPRIGFFGVIDERLDAELVEAVAKARPDWQLCMVGPVVKIDPEGLPRLPNLHWLGPMPYGDLPDLLRGLDVGLMPFALNESTRFISPTKTPEYLAAGVPVVSTPITDVVRPYGDAGLVAIAHGPDAVVAAVAGLLARGPDPGWLDRVDALLATTSWDRTWAAMEGAMARVGAGRVAEAAE